MKNITLSVEIVDSIEVLPAETRAEIYSMIFAYAFSGVLPSSPSPTAKAFFMLIKPQIDKQIRRAEGKKAHTKPEADDKTPMNIDRLFTPENEKRHVEGSIKPKLRSSAHIIDNFRLFVESASRAGALRSIAMRPFDEWVQLLPQRLEEYLKSRTSVGLALKP